MRCRCGQRRLPPTSAEQVCAEARKYGASVCVELMTGAAGVPATAASPVESACTVVGFPLGASATTMKVQEAETAIRAGAEEIDMRSTSTPGPATATPFVEDIQAVVQAAHKSGAIVKVIETTALLDDRQKDRGHAGEASPARNS